MAQIILASKNETIRGYLSSKVKRAGHAVTRVSDFGIAISLLSEVHYDLLITAVDVGDSEGLELAHEAQNLDPEIPILFITGFSAVSLEPLQYHHQKESSLGPPIHLSKLVAEIDRLIAA